MTQAQKTWRKHHAATLLATQSIKELATSGMLTVVAESCPTKIFLANPDMEPQVYRDAFGLNDTAVHPDRRPSSAWTDAHSQTDRVEKVHLHVDSLSYWMATNNAKDNLLKQQYFELHGIAEGLRLPEQRNIHTRSAESLRMSHDPKPLKPPSQESAHELRPPPVPSGRHRRDGRPRAEPTRP